MIMNGCVEYAKICGSTRVESELLPQMWEQISHKYYERRLLVAEACGVLAPYTPVSHHLKHFIVGYMCCTVYMVYLSIHVLTIQAAAFSILYMSAGAILSHYVVIPDPYKVCIITNHFRISSI